MTLPLGQLFSLSKMTFQPPWLLKKFFLGLTWLAFQDSLEWFPRESTQKIFSEFPDLSYNLFQVPEYPVHTCQSILCTECYFTGLALVCVCVSLHCAWTLRVLVPLFFFDLFIPVCLVAQSCPALCDPMDCSPPGSSVHGNSPGKDTGVGCHALLQAIFPTQRSNSGLLHCRWILYLLSHQGSLGQGSNSCFLH